jgi:hypothetical protein
MKRRAKKIEYRYKRVGAPYKKKSTEPPMVEYFDNEKKARKSPHYESIK